jgi:hypothetical protein
VRDVKTSRKLTKFKGEIQSANYQALSHNAKSLLHQTVLSRWVHHAAAETLHAATHGGNRLASTPPQTEEFLYFDVRRAKHGTTAVVVSIECRVYLP